MSARKAGYLFGTLPLHSVWVIVVTVVAAVALDGCASQKRATRKKDDASDYNTQLGIAYLRQGDVPLAKEKLDRALQENPDNPKVHSARAMLFDRMGETKLADSEYQTALHLAPDDPDVSNNYAVYLCQLGRADEGVRRFEAVARNALYRTPWVAYTNAGVCLRRAKRNADAAKNFKQALQLRPNFSEAAYQLADLQFRRWQPGRCARAGRHLSERFRGNSGPAAARSPDRARAERPGCGGAVLAQAAPRFPELGPGESAGRSRTQPGLIPMAAEAGGDIRAGIGTRLRAAREKKGLTLLQAAERMHVDARIVESLEAENFAALGAPVYARGHLRHYAELVDESAAELQQLYADATRAAPAQPDLTRIARMEPSNDPGKLVGPAVIGLVAVALVGTVWWVLTLSVDKVQPTPVHNRLESNTAESNAQSRGPARVRTAAATRRLTPAPGADLRLRCPRQHPSRRPQRGQKALGQRRRNDTRLPRQRRTRQRAATAQHRRSTPATAPCRTARRAVERHRAPAGAAREGRRAHPEILSRQLGRSLRRLGPASVLRRGCGSLGAHGEGPGPTACHPRQCLGSCCRVQRSSGADSGRRSARRKRAVCHQRARTDRPREPRIRRRLSWQSRYRLSVE